MTRKLGYIHKSHDTGRIFDRLKILTRHFAHTGPFKIFALFTRGALKGWASKFSYGLRDSVWTEHFSAQILTRSKIRLVKCEHCLRNILSYNKSRLFVNTAKPIMEILITKLTKNASKQRKEKPRLRFNCDQQLFAQPLINLPLETQQMWRHNTWSFHHNWQCKVFRSCLDQTTYSWWGENAVHKDKHRHRLSMNPTKSKQKVRI